MNIFAEMVHAVTDRRSYALFIQDKKRKTFLFGVLLAALYFLVSIMVPYAQFQIRTGGIVRIADEVLPDFTLDHGRMSVDQIFDMVENDTYIYVNTDDFQIDEQQVKAITNEYDAVLMMDAERVILLNDGKLQTIEFADLGEFTLTKSSLLQILKPYVTIITVVILVVIFLFMQAGLFFGVLFVALFGMIVASAMKERMTFGTLYQMGVYSRTTPVLLKAVVSLLPVHIPFFWLLGLGISLFYIAGGIQEVREHSSDWRYQYEK